MPSGKSSPTQNMDPQNMETVGLCQKALLTNSEMLRQEKTNGLPCE